LLPSAPGLSLARHAVTTSCPGQLANHRGDRRVWRWPTTAN